MSMWQWLRVCNDKQENHRNQRARNNNDITTLLKQRKIQSISPGLQEVRKHFLVGVYSGGG